MNFESINFLFYNKIFYWNLIEDESLFIGFDRLQNLIIDTDYHRRKSKINIISIELKHIFLGIENTVVNNKPEKYLNS
jgi:hypothetical protein